MKTIAKGRASKLTKDINSDSNGITLASIKLKTDDVSTIHNASNGANNDSMDTRSMFAYNDTAHR